MWKVRHEGSPQHAEATLEEVRQALVDGLWEPTDEVMGPGESEWVAMENHPQFEELCLELEPPKPPPHEDETRLDMNALIDVCLVLLVFFMLTTTVAALQVRLEAPEIDEGKAKVKVVTQEAVEQTMVLVSITKSGDKVTIKVEDDEVDPANLTTALRRHVRRTGKTQVALQHDDEVPHGVVVQVIDAAKGVGVDSVKQIIPAK